MVFAYLFAQLLPWHRGRPGALLLLGSSNVDEWFVMGACLAKPFLLPLSNDCGRIVCACDMSTALCS